MRQEIDQRQREADGETKKTELQQKHGSSRVDQRKRARDEIERKCVSEWRELALNSKMAK